MIFSINRVTGITPAYALDLWHRLDGSPPSHCCIAIMQMVGIIKQQSLSNWKGFAYIVF